MRDEANAAGAMWIDPVRERRAAQAAERAGFATRRSPWDGMSLGQLEAALAATKERVDAAWPHGAEYGDVIDRILLEHLVVTERALSWRARCLRSMRRSRFWQALAQPVSRLLYVLIEWLGVDRGAT
jgi:hypothetical protein